MVFSAFQAMHLIVCIGLTVYDAVEYQSTMLSHLVWIVLVVYVFPAVIGFGHAMVGLRIYYSRKEPFIKQASHNAFEPYSTL